MEVSEEEFLAEKEEIERTYRAIKVGQVFRQTSMAWYKKWGAEMKYPFIPMPYSLPFAQRSWFGDCLNVNFETAPRLSDIGEVPEGVIPKKFIWSESLKPVGYVEPKDDDEEEEEEDE